MKITINHDDCEHGGAFADRCLGATIRDPLGHERFCMARIEDDGKPELTVTLIEEGEARTIILHDKEQREIAATLGWQAFENHELVAEDNG